MGKATKKPKAKQATTKPTGSKWNDPKYLKLKKKAQTNNNGTNETAVTSIAENRIPNQPFVPLVYVRITSPGTKESDKAYLELTLPPSKNSKQPSSGNIGLDMTVKRQAKNNQPAGVTLEMTFADETAVLVEEALESALHGGVSDLGNDKPADQPKKKNKTKKKDPETGKNSALSKIVTTKTVFDNDKKNKVKKRTASTDANKITITDSTSPFKKNSRSLITNFSANLEAFSEVASTKTTTSTTGNPYEDDISAAQKILKSVGDPLDRNLQSKKAKAAKRAQDKKSKAKKSNKDKSDKGSNQTASDVTDTAGLDFYYGYYNNSRSQMYHCTIKDATIEFTSYGTRVTVQAVSTSTAEGAQPQYKSYKTGNPAEIVKEIAQRDGWDIGTVVSTETVYDTPAKVVKGKTIIDKSKPAHKKVFTQNGVGDTEFINKTLIPYSYSNIDGSSDYVFWMTQGSTAPAVNFAPKTYKAQYDKANKNGQPSKTYTFKWGSVSDTSVRSFVPDYSLAKSSFKPDSISAVTLEKFSNAMFNTQYDKSNSSWISSYANSTGYYSANYPLTLGGSTYTFQQLETTAARMWFLNMNNSYRATLNIIGDPTLEPQSAIAVIVMNPNGLPHHTSGIYLILSITDTIQGGLFNSALELIKLPTTPDEGGSEGITGITVHKGNPQDTDGTGSGTTKTSKDPSDDDTPGASGKWIKPISGPWGTNCNGFGPNHPAPGRKNNFHDGYDFGSANHGTKIRACHAGQVVVAKYLASWSKQYIAIKSGSYYHIYQEFSSNSSDVLVKKGDTVKTGQHIANLNGGTHLHLGINAKTCRESLTHPYDYGHWRNPRTFIKSHS